MKEKFVPQSGMLRAMKRIITHAIAEAITPIYTRLDKIDGNIDDLIEGQKFMANMMVTHDELETKLTELSDDLKSHTTIECEKVRQDITSLTKKVDGRVDDLTVTLQVKKILTQFETTTLLASSPFI